VGQEDQGRGLGRLARGKFFFTNELCSIGGRYFSYKNNSKRGSAIVSCIKIA
jgi:hypothetical protein